MKEIVKRRLVGAAVLVALGGLLPFVLVQWLDGGGAGQDGSVRVYEIQPDGQARPVRGAAGGDERDEGADEPAADAETPGAVAAPEPEPEPEFEATAAGQETTEAAPEAEPAPSEPPSQQSAAEPAARAPAQTRDGVPQAEDEPAGPAWSVQVGSFKSEDNARDLMRTLASDYPAFYAEGSVDGVTYYRVRVGPYASEAAAEDAAAALSAQGRTVQVRREEG